MTISLIAPPVSQRPSYAIASYTRHRVHFGQQAPPPGPTPPADEASAPKVSPAPPAIEETGWVQRTLVQPLLRLAHTLLRLVKSAWASLSGQLGPGVEYSMNRFNERFNAGLQTMESTLATLERESRVMAAAQKLHVPLIQDYHPPVLLTRPVLEDVIAAEIAPRLEVATLSDTQRAHVATGVSDALREVFEKRPYDATEAALPVTLSPEAPSANAALYARRRTLQLLNEANPVLTGQYFDRVVTPMYTLQRALPGVTDDERKAYDRAYQELRDFYQPPASSPEPPSSSPSPASQPPA